ncbi:hypothetical protein BJX99DRAFT_264438 [Aspergillus californicus]
MASLRRYIWSWCLFLALLLALIVLRLPVRRPGFPLHLLSGSSKPPIRPGDFAKCNRQWTPSDDDFPPAHEPIGQGTLRNVREQRFYLGGTSTVESSDDYSPPGPAVYDPYPDYNGEEWARHWNGTFRACEGPRGRTISRENPEDMVLAYPGVQKDFPYPAYGSYEALELDGCSCTTRASRLGAYGYTEPAPDSITSGIPWDSVNWKTLQSQCLERNANRYTIASERPPSDVLPLKPLRTAIPREDEGDQSSPSAKTRSAVVLRAWHDMEWTENMRHHVRSLVMELSLHSGAEYEVFLLTHVRENNIPLYGPNEDDNVRLLKEKFIPPEFWDITILFNEQTLESWYPKVEEHKPLHQHLQPVQVFSSVFPDFDFYWQLEMDVRLTGHAYHFLERASEFAKQQPRKYLWERNAHFYIPGVHGTWEDFRRLVDESMANKETVWGPAPPPDLSIDPVGPKPPVARPQDDSYQWGTGEEADLIKFLPIFDPSETSWVFSHLLWGLQEQTPRRASPVTMGRFSNRLLRVIHEAQAEEGVALVSEMTAPSFALWHGLKVVHVPQPLYADGKWTPKELASIVNRGPPEKINGKPDSFWNWDHQFDHIMYRMTYMFTAQTAEDFYRRWLGYKVDTRQYTDGSYHQDPQGRNWFDGGDLREDLYGALCFPAMLLHPIKNTAPQKGHGMAVPV